ncbi:MAG: hypothetical protein V3W34_18545 [Phycisphaerae bacterium]
MNATDVRPGMKIRVTQRIERRRGPWDTQTVGTILSAEPKATGSWFAHGKNGKYWLVRLELQKDDGEITTLTLDRNTRIMVLDG